MGEGGDIYRQGERRETKEEREREREREREGGGWLLRFSTMITFSLTSGKVQACI